MIRVRGEIRFDKEFGALGRVRGHDISGQFASYRQWLITASRLPKSQQKSQEKSQEKRKSDPGFLSPTLFFVFFFDNFGAGQFGGV